MFDNTQSTITGAIILIYINRNEYLIMEPASQQIEQNQINNYLLYLRKKKINLFMDYLCSSRTDKYADGLNKVHKYTY